MSIVISPLVRLVITDADTTNFNYATNKATEISILKDIKVERAMSSIIGRAETVSTTSNRVPPLINTGYSSVTLSFSTYLKPIIDSGSVVSTEKLLWESLSATDTSDSSSVSVASFTAGNTNKLRELYFYLIYEDGTYYKIKQGVVSAVDINMNIDGIAMANWNVQALSIDYIGTSNLTGTPKDYTDHTTFLRNKLSTLSINIGSTNYDVAILKGKFSINNDVKIINRNRVGEILIPSGHYVGARLAQLDASFYLNTKTDGSSTLLSDLLSYSTLSGVNTLTNVTLSIGGVTSTLRVDIPMPTSKINLTNPEIGLFSTVDISVIPQESSIGLGNELTVRYIDTTNGPQSGSKSSGHTYYWFGQQHLEWNTQYYNSTTFIPNPAGKQDLTYYWFGQQLIHN